MSDKNSKGNIEKKYLSLLRYVDPKEPIRVLSIHFSPINLQLEYIGFIKNYYCRVVNMLFR